jgi:hypothetical protein
MLKIKKILFSLLFISCLLSSLDADEGKKFSLYYIKIGLTKVPGDSSAILPSFGLGARFQRDYCGFDLSANIGSIVFNNYVSLKGIFLFYPQPQKKHQLYFGIGPGIGYHLNSIPLGDSFGSASDERGNVTIEGVLGYEFRHAPHFKTFIQIELSQPVFGFYGQGRHCSYKPGIAFTGGIGF